MSNVWARRNVGTIYYAIIFKKVLDVVDSIRRLKNFANTDTCESTAIHAGAKG